MIRILTGDCREVLKMRFIPARFLILSAELARLGLLLIV